MKKIITVLIGVAMILSCFIVPASASEDSITVETGAEIELTVGIGEYADINSGSIAFDYDKDVFEIVSSEWLIENVFVNDFNPTEGKGVFAYASATNTSGNIFTLVLRVKEDAAFDSTDLSIKVQLKNNTANETYVAESRYTFVLYCDHVFSDIMSGDENSHWYACTKCNGVAAGGKIEVKEHTFDNACDESCNICGFVKEVSHIYSPDWTVDLEPTCTEQGSKSYHCLYCSHQTEITEIPANGHSPSDWIVDVEPTIDTDGSKHKECAVCGETLETKAIPMLSHAFEVTVTPPTCTEMGYTTYSCSDCGLTFADDFVPATGHSVIINEAVEPTCTEPGYTEGTSCSVCGEVLVAQETLDPIGHDMGEWMQIIAPTCTARGEGRRYCYRCDFFENCVIPAIGHTEVIDAAIAPTCTGTGLTAGKHCAVCSEVLVAQQVLDAKGHNFDEWQVIREPTEAEKGEKRRDCKDCEAFETDVIDELAHVHSNWDVIIMPQVDPTCTEFGLSEGERCSGCNEILKAQNVIPPLGHCWDEGVITVEPTCTEQGTKLYTCQNDPSHTRTEDIEAIGHIYEAVETAPTCTEQGYTTYTCTCGDSYTDEVVPATGHSFGEWYITIEPTEYESGEKRRDCEACDEYETDVVEAADHDHSKWDVIILEGIAPTCTETGYTEGQQCSGCGEILAEREIIPALGHDWDDGVVSIEPTCEDNGLKTYTCKNDHSHVRTEEMEATDHSYEAAVTEPTCTKKGYTTYTCTNCGDSYKGDKVSAIGHAYDDDNDASCNNCGKMRNVETEETGESDQTGLDKYVDIPISIMQGCGSTIGASSAVVIAVMLFASAVFFGKKKEDE